MRRISILALVMLFSVSSVARSRYYGSRRFRTPVRYRTRYSPYALGHDRTGLISGDVRYSPYALGHSGSGLVSSHLRYSPYALGRSSSGLVPDNVRYSPYALGHDRSGLVADSYHPYYYANYYPYNIIISDQDSYDLHITDHDVESADYNVPQRPSNSFQQNPKPSWEITFHHNDFQKQVTEPKEPDAKLVIYNYLKGKKIDFKMERIFTIEGKTISANFLIRDKNVVIKYWNPEHTKQMSNRPDFYNNIYDKYLRTWDTLLEGYQKAGWIVSEITSSGQKEILDQLSSLTQLNG